LPSRPRTEEIPKSGISITRHGPSNPSTTTNLGISKDLVDQETCKSGALTLDGGRSSLTQDNTLSISKTERFLMLQVEKIKKAKESLFGDNIKVLTKDGRLSILTNLPRSQLQA
jgi:hypothetical protein